MRALVELGSEMIVWIVAALAAIETFLEGATAFAEGRIASAVIWGLGGVGMFAFALVVENVKLLPEG